MPRHFGHFRRRLAGLRSFHADKRAVSAIEFSMILPFLLILLIGMEEVTGTLNYDRKVSRIANSVADLVAQAQTITPADLSAMMARHFIITKVGEWMETKTLDIDRFGADYKVKHWAMQHWEARDKTGHFLVRAFGFTKDNFPGGPAKLMAAIDSLEHAVVHAVEQTGQEFETLGTFERSLDAATSDGAFDFDTWMQLPELHRLAQRTGRGFLRYFRDSPPVQAPA